MKKKYLMGAMGIVILIGTLLSIEQKSTAKVPYDKLTVVTSFYPLYFFTQSIGGDKVHVVNITPAGAEPHDYEPTPQDIATIERSELVILNGGHLEAWGDDIRKNIDPSKTTLITAGENLTTQTVAEDGKEITDPHVWLSPLLAKQEVEKILVGIETIDPVNKTYYEQNAAVLLRDLDMLDQEYRVGLQSCKRKDFVTSHAAFGYIATAYGLHQVPIAGLSPDTEPSPKDLADITQFVRKQGINFIFFESLVSPKLAQTIANETHAKTMVLDPIEGIVDTDLATGKNYLTVMNDNLTNLRTALNCL